ncbi:MAG TPA: bifunctional glycosyltransferase family 2/GtrA family protein [Candidatus Blautia faecigallinarum]|uniref:Bifunctional glycosyltransferase family 2/GtrA family protein n=1 Tax=Candidatus Blautia faecigallinarum TaxID=2838488 RepID=A0A9D2DQJ1_9FIRM|nr:bifunctional glycosyltransferase family 2/GtrA family protein [Candidatus Blautia faecigallinarum]
MKKKCVILIPALDPPDEFYQYVQELTASGFQHIIVVDDGSRDKNIFQRLSMLPQVTLLTHEKNYGKGKALRTGFSYYRDHFSMSEYTGVITVDSDGQHLLEDVNKIRDALSFSDGRLILGVRDFNQENVPPKSRFGNKLTGWIFRHFVKLSVSDTQTGLRGIPNSLIDPCLSVSGDRFEYETDMLIKVGRSSGIQEIPIHTVYHRQNEGTHFHPIKDSFLIYRLLFGRFFRYLTVSLSSFLLDIGLFAFGTKILLSGFSHSVPVSAVGARIISAAYNYLMNRNVVFKSSSSYLASGASYLTLCVIQGLVSAALVTAGSMLLPIDEVLIKVVVDTCLFLVNYHVQKTWIFRH